MTSTALAAKVVPGSDTTVGNLKSTSALYQNHVNLWTFLRAAFNGAKAMIDWGVLRKHERESPINFERRQEEAYGFGYSRSVINLFVYYLHKEPVSRSVGNLESNDLWKLFLKDCDLEKRSYEEFVKDVDKDSSIEGCVGILVDKPSKSVVTREDEIKNKIYPYVSRYRPQDILDFEYTRDEYGRPVLSYLKVVDGDSRYLVWTLTNWAIYEFPDVDDKGNPLTAVTDQMVAKLVSTGANLIGEIPFVWIYNEDMVERGNGVSDIVDISLIDGSIIANLSQIDEIIDFGAFPMMRKPKPEKGEAVDDEVGPTSILEFDPENPEAKPDWLESKVAEPVEAILHVVEKKISEIYRASNAGGMGSTEIQSEARSGLALRTEFQLLNSKLVNRGQRLSVAEFEMIRLWKKWQLISTDDHKLEYSDTYDVEALAQDLENALTAKRIIHSDTFHKKMEKKLIRQMLPAEDPRDLAVMDKEIDEYVAPDPFSFNEDGENPFEKKKEGDTTDKNESVDTRNQQGTDEDGNVIQIKQQ